MNTSGLKQLGMTSEVIGEKVKIQSTGDTLNNYKEYKLSIRQKTFTVVGELYLVDLDMGSYSKILIFNELKQVTNQLYEMTTAINNMSTSSIIGLSEKTLPLKEAIEKVAKSSSTILITGESGTGKEMVASAIWKASNRQDKAFVAINL